MFRFDPLTRDCRSDFPAYHHQGERLLSSIRYIVLHSTEGQTAQSAASRFMQPGSGGSTNLVVDAFACYRCLGDNVIPQAAAPLNVHGFHIEQAGYASWSRSRWLANGRTVKRAAYKAALRCRWYHIPARVLTVEQLVKDFGQTFTDAAGVDHFQAGPLNGGIVTHATVSEAFGQSDHTDPGDSYPVDVFLGYVEGFLK